MTTSSITTLLLLLLIILLALARRRNAVRVVFTVEDVMLEKLELKVGGAPKIVLSHLKTDAGTEDPSFEGAKYAFAGGTVQEDGSLLSADGSVKVEVFPDNPLKARITALAVSPEDGGVPIPSILTFGADSDAGPGQQLIAGELPIVVLADNATRVEFEEVAE